MRNQPNLQVISSNADQPTVLQLNNHKFKVVQILQFWRTRNNWWRTGRVSETKCWRLLARSAQQSVVIEICYHEATQQWELIRKLVK